MTNDKHTCPICESALEAAPTELPNTFGGVFKCPQCGPFLIGWADADADGIKNLLAGQQEKRLRLSHRLRWMSRDHGPPNLSAGLIYRFVEQPLPSLFEQVDNLVLWLGRTTKHGHPEDIVPTRYQAIVGSDSIQGLAYVLKYLKEAGQLEGEFDTSGGGFFQLTFAGWRCFDELTRGARTSRRAFMAMAFNKPDLDDLVEKCFRPAVRQTGFELTRIDDEPEAGLIDNRLLVRIRLARFLIVDLTHDNAGAYWEAGFAEGLGKPVIYTCEGQKFKEKGTHFDTDHHQTVRWEAASPRKAAEDLKATIRATFPGEALMEDSE